MEEDEDLYLKAHKELNSKRKKEAVWIKALTISKGDSKAAKYEYINLRVESLKNIKDTKHESLDEINFDNLQKYNDTIVETGGNFSQWLNSKESIKKPQDESYLENIQKYNDSITEKPKKFNKWLNSNDKNIISKKVNYKVVNEKQVQVTRVTYNPIIAFFWSAILYALSGYLIDQEGFKFFVGIICLGLGFLSTKYLYGSTILLSGYIIHLTCIIVLFSGMIMVNNLEFIKYNIYLNHFILGIVFTCIILSGYRFVMYIRK